MTTPNLKRLTMGEATCGAHGAKEMDDPRCLLCRVKMAEQRVSELEAALRRERDDALNEALAEVPSNQPDTRDRIRALASPAAAPAAEECTSTSGTILCNDRTCRAHGKRPAPPSEPVAPADPCRAEVSSRFPDYSHFECTLPKGHAGPHKEGGFAEWTDAEHHDGAALADGGE
jgi:hypothetical protein